MAFKNHLRWLLTAASFTITLPAMGSLFYDEEIQTVRPSEPAMADAVPPQTLNDIRDIMIKESIKKHGFCACPYSTDALGGQCGSLSAYYYPWNNIMCYRRDISNDEVYFYRLSRAMNAYQAQLDKEEAEMQAAAEAQNCDAKKETAKKKKEITSDYFRNAAKPPPNTITLPTNVSLPSQDFSDEEGLTSNYYRNVVPVTPATNMPTLIAPPVPATP
jgi:hypothetical protein